jgi:hypothetical protein
MDEVQKPSINELVSNLAIYKRRLWRRDAVLRQHTSEVKRTTHLVNELYEVASEQVGNPNF